MSGESVGSDDRSLHRTLHPQELSSVGGRGESELKEQRSQQAAEERGSVLRARQKAEVPVFETSCHFFLSLSRHA